MSVVTLDWSTAEVKKSRLTVALEGDIPSGWDRSFETVAKLLGDGDWGEISVKEGIVQVSDVEPGSEDKLRHHLESILAQANANHEPESDERDDASQSDSDSGDEDDHDDSDAGMTGRFQSFAEGAEDSEHSGESKGSGE